VILEDTLTQLCTNAQNEGRFTLLEPELYSVLRLGGLSTPEYYTININKKDFEQEIQSLPSKKVVLKVVSPQIVHKKALGGVRIVNNNPTTISTQIREMLSDVRSRGGEQLFQSVKMILVNEFISNFRELGSQVFAGLRWTHDMGHIFAFGIGGSITERLNQQLPQGFSIVLLSPHLLTVEDAMQKFSDSFAYEIITQKNGHPPGDSKLRDVLRFFFHLATRFSNSQKRRIILRDFEINPFIVSNGNLVAVDVFLNFKSGYIKKKLVDKDAINCLLKPKIIAVLGVSRKENNIGRVILNNIKRETFPEDNLWVIRSDGKTVDSVPCCPSIHDLPSTIDTLVVAVPGFEVPGVVKESISSNRGKSVILIPGGMGETESGKAINQTIVKYLEKARAKGEQIPAILGPNSLGIRSKPGHYNTLFIPDIKFPPPTGKISNVAFICQSGAFMITRMNDLMFLDPPYAISTGNQMDLTVTDFVETLLSDHQVKIFALYIEGFKSLDGLRLAKLIQQGKTDGKDFIIYKAGRTSEGVTATTSHTASLAGDYRTIKEVLMDAGALVSSSFDEFKAHLTLASLLRGKVFSGFKLGAISNAGYETVGMADSVMESWGFSLPELSQFTRKKIETILQDASIKTLITTRNPLDLTPMATDHVFALCTEVFLEEKKLDGVILGVVPLTPVMKTLPPGMDVTGIDTIKNPFSLPSLLTPIVTSSQKPFIIVIDAGKLYDPYAESFEKKGVPCFRSADFAIRMFQQFIRYKLR